MSTLPGEHHSLGANMVEKFLAAGTGAPIVIVGEELETGC
jgi:hypothetical protein